MPLIRGIPASTLAFDLRRYHKDQSPGDENVVHSDAHYLSYP